MVSRRRGCAPLSGFQLRQCEKRSRGLIVNLNSSEQDISRRFARLTRNPSDASMRPSRSSIGCLGRTASGITSVAGA